MRRIVSWFVDNAVAANMLMLVLIGGGIFTLLTIRQEEFPSIDLDIIQISVPYLGAAPEEAEEGVCIRIEEAIEGTPGIDRMTSIAVEGGCSVFVELVLGTDANWAGPRPVSGGVSDTPTKESRDATPTMGDGLDAYETGAAPISGISIERSSPAVEVDPSLYSYADEDDEEP